jgi:hypothetical protein
MDIGEPKIDFFYLWQTRLRKPNVIKQGEIPVATTGIEQTGHPTDCSSYSVISIIRASNDQEDLIKLEQPLTFKH